MSTFFYLRFTTELSRQLIEARTEFEDIGPEPILVQDSWMVLSEMRPSDDDYDEINGVEVDNSFDWLENSKTYTNEQINDMRNWVNSKKIMAQDIGNDDQLEIVNFNQLNRLQKFCYKIIQCYNEKNKQLFMIINGTAGTGKSFTIAAISNLIGNRLKRAAPTAKAAFIIKGETIHSTFSISVTKKETDINVDLKGERLSELQEKFRNVSHIIIDEYSMLSQVLFAQIDHRLRQATGRFDLLFGGLSIILVGDPGQLLPVSGMPLYAFPTKSLLASHGLNCYRNFKIVIRLEQSERQKNANNDPNQEYFINMLLRLRNMDASDSQLEDDWKFILKNVETPESLSRFADAIRLFPDNASCNAYNAEKLKSLNSPITLLQAKNTNSRCKNGTDDSFSGLKNYIYLAKGAKITLTNNLWTKQGLVNGANGVVRDIVYEKVGDEIKPIAILVDFEKYNGPKFFDQNDSRNNWIPINPISLFCKNLNGSRTQFPLRLAYALTIHKSQGQTIDKIVIDLGKSEQSLGLTFVALSRVRNFSDFIIKPLSLDRLLKIKKSISLKPRQDEENLMTQYVNNTFNEFKDLLNL